MAKFLIEAKYVGDGIKGLLKEGGTSRRAAVEDAAKTVGGSVEAFYYAFGETDAFVVIDVPDNVAASSLALTVAASGVVLAENGRVAHAGGHRSRDGVVARLQGSRSVGLECMIPARPAVRSRRRGRAGIRRDDAAWAERLLLEAVMFGNRASRWPLPRLGRAERCRCFAPRCRSASRHACRRSRRDRGACCVRGVHRQDDGSDAPPGEPGEGVAQERRRHPAAP